MNLNLYNDNTATPSSDKMNQQEKNHDKEVIKSSRTTQEEGPKKVPNNFVNLFAHLPQQQKQPQLSTPIKTEVVTEQQEQPQLPTLIKPIPFKSVVVYPPPQIDYKTVLKSAYVHLLAGIRNSEGVIVGCQHSGKNVVLTYDLMNPNTGTKKPGDLCLFHNVAKSACCLTWEWIDPNVTDMRLEPCFVPTGVYSGEQNSGLSKTVRKLTEQSNTCVTCVATPAKKTILINYVGEHSFETHTKHSMWFYPSVMSRKQYLMMAIRIHYVQDGRNAYTEPIPFPEIYFHVDKTKCTCESTSGGDRKRNFVSTKNKETGEKDTDPSPKIMKIEID